MLYCFSPYRAWEDKLHTARADLCPHFRERSFSFDSTELSESLTSLSDKGLILFVQNQEHPQSSWVVVEKDALLREVNGTLFAPDNFKQYRQVASNTGIVPIATLEELFHSTAQRCWWAVSRVWNSVIQWTPQHFKALTSRATKLLHHPLHQEPAISSSRV